MVNVLYKTDYIQSINDGMEHFINKDKLTSQFALITHFCFYLNSEGHMLEHRALVKAKV